MEVWSCLMVVMGVWRWLMEVWGWLVVVPLEVWGWLVVIELVSDDDEVYWLWWMFWDDGEVSEWSLRLTDGFSAVMLATVEVWCRLTIRIKLLGWVVMRFLVDGNKWKFQAGWLMFWVVCNRGNQGHEEAQAFRAAVDSSHYSFISRWIVWGHSHLSVHSVCSLVHLSSASVLQDKSVETKEGQTVEESRYETACQKLASEAVRRGCADNVTVILISIDFWPISLSHSHQLSV